MTPAEHYREAERLLNTIPTLLDRADRLRLPESTLAASINGAVAQAQVHATLATCRDFDAEAPDDNPHRYTYGGAA